jgi:hypothetical protein
MGAEREYIDYTVFLGMNAAEEPVRLRCKALIASRLDGAVFMTWDHVGRCDDFIWQHSRALQDRYYPFMDALASHASLRREGYEDTTLLLATLDSRLQGLPILHRLLVARALERDSVVYTLDPGLLGHHALPVRPPPPCHTEAPFPGWLEPLYQGALELRIPLLATELEWCSTV